MKAHTNHTHNSMIHNSIITFLKICNFICVFYSDTGIPSKRECQGNGQMFHFSKIFELSSILHTFYTPFSLRNINCYRNILLHTSPIFTVFTTVTFEQLSVLNSCKSKSTFHQYKTEKPAKKLLGRTKVYRYKQVFLIKGTQSLIIVFHFFRCCN